VWCILLEHLLSCVRRASEVKVQRAQYNEEYPYHCRHCEGWGGMVVVPEPVEPVIAGLLSEDDDDDMPEVEPCSCCITQERCPRCGSGIDPDGNDACEFCGFTDGRTEGKAYPHECFCAQLEEEL
jgi:hypothetical protein